MTIARALIVPLAALGVIAAVGCGEHAEHAELDLTPITATVTPVERIDAIRTIDVYGIVQPARQSVLSSRVMGPVVEVMVEAGDTVAKNAPLIKIAPQTIEGQVSQAKGALAQAEAALALAEKNYSRYEALHQEKAASDLELDMAKMQRDQAKAAVDQAKGAVASASSVAEEAVVRAPFAARVVDKMVEVGDMAAPGRPLVRVESLAGRTMWLTVREADIGRVKVGQDLDVRFDSRPDLGTVTGSVSEIVPSADPATHTFTVKVALPDKLELKSGLSGRATIQGDAVSRLVIPAQAVFQRGGLQLVVVRADDGTARTLAVTTGAALPGDRIEVLSGLDAGQQVVVNPPGPVADGTPVEVAS